MRRSPTSLPGESGEPLDHEAIRRALLTQSDPDADEASLIRERLEWSPGERLAANDAFVGFALSVRPEGPLLRD